MRERNPILLVAGCAANVWLCRQENGRCQAKEFLEGLSKKARAKFLNTMKRLALSGRINDTSKFKHLKNQDFWEVRIKAAEGAFRMFCFVKQGEWYLTHGFQKKTSETPQTEINRAKRIRKECESKG